MKSKNGIAFSFLVSMLACCSTFAAGDSRVEPKYVHNSNPEAGYRIAYITFDEFGHFTNRRSFVDVYNNLNELRQSKRRVLVVTFIHGWRHNAEPGDSNVCCFEKLISELTQELHNSNTFKEDDLVLGIYLGWQGKKRVFLSEKASFWDRKDAADEVSNGHIIKVLSTLEVFRTYFNDRMTLLTIGHSFGGRILYNAIGNVFVARVMDKLSPVGPGLGDKVAGSSGLGSRASLDPFPGSEPTVRGLVGGFGDLVVLVNPAFEASRYHVLNDLQTSGQRFESKQPPIMLIVSATNDEATRRWFPIARSLEVNRFDAANDTQYREITETIGNYKPFRTHQLKWCPSLPEITSAPASECRCDGEQLDIGASEQLGIASNSSCNGPLQLVEDRGDSVSEHASNNPFLIASVPPPTIINGHNGIFTRPFVQFLISFLNDTRGKM